jgi:hypothetical protein
MMSYAIPQPFYRYQRLDHSQDPIEPKAAGVLQKPLRGAVLNGQKPRTSPRELLDF